MSDYIMAFLSLATVIAFLAVIAVFVPHIDLIIVITLVCALATYDFWTSLRDKRDNN